MKVFALVLLASSSLTETALGFSAAPVSAVKAATASSSSALHSAVAPPEEDPWNQPLTRHEQTVPVADREVNWLQRQVMDDVMLDPDYTLTWTIAALCPLIIWYHPSYFTDGSPSLIGVAGGLFHLLFAALLWVQTRRVRCVFEKDAFEFYNIKGPGTLDFDKGAKLTRKPDNYVSGTQNRWTYDTIINYGFFPSFEFPVICYFKETATPKEQWNKWFAAFDSYQNGQPHFFPGICNVHQFKAEMEKRGAKRKPIKTLKQSSKE